MATVQSTLSRAPVQNNVDLLRRYCPALAVHTHAQVAAHIVGSATGCWPWDGSITEAGYGYVSCEPTPYGASQCVPVHRYMHELFVGEIPYGYDIHHRCHYRACWHPLHLEALTPQEHHARHHPRPPAWQSPNTARLRVRRMRD